jgi:hypothetical protein
MPRRTWLRVAERGGVVVKVRKDGMAAAAVVRRVVVRGRRVAGAKNWRRMEPTMVGGTEGRAREVELAWFGVVTRSSLACSLTATEALTTRR